MKYKILMICAILVCSLLAFGCSGNGNKGQGTKMGEMKTEIEILN